MFAIITDERGNGSLVSVDDIVTIEIYNYGKTRYGVKIELINKRVLYDCGHTLEQWTVMLENNRKLLNY